jgi:hypothetical protein
VAAAVLKSLAFCSAMIGHPSSQIMIGKIIEKIQASSTHLRRSLDNIPHP